MTSTTYCKKHGKQRAIGNYDECEKCVIEDMKQQERQLEISRRNMNPHYGTVFTGRF